VGLLGQSYGSQVIGNVVQGKSIDKVFTDIDWGDVAEGTVSGAIAGGTMGMASVVEMPIWGILATGGIGAVAGGQAGSLANATVDEVTSGEGWNTGRFWERAQASGLGNPVEMIKDFAAGMGSAGITEAISWVAEPFLSQVSYPLVKGGLIGFYKFGVETLGQVIDTRIHEIMEETLPE